MLSLDSGNYFLLCAEIFKFDNNPVFNFYLCFLRNWSPIKKSITYPCFFSVFSCSSFKVSGLTFRSLMYIELIFVQKQRQGSNISLLCVYIPFSQHLLLKRLSFIQHMLLASFSKIRWLDLFGFISGSSILFHWSSCLFLCQYYAVFVTVAQYYNLKSGINISSIALFEQD
jgi:hypothetical protein